MDLLILRLHAPIDYASPGTAGPADPLPEPGYEDLRLYSNVIVDTKDSGPTVVAPLPSPVFFGRSFDRPEPAPAGERFRLEAGEYCFAQTRDADAKAGDPDACLRELLEEFVRDAWWEGEPLDGPLMVRRVWEDGKFALQILRRRVAARPGTDAG